MEMSLEDACSEETESSSDSSESTGDVEGGDQPAQPTVLPWWLRKMLTKQDDGALLEDLRRLFPRDEHGRLSDLLGNMDHMDQEVQDYLVQNDDECRQLADFVERSADFVKCRQNTVSGPEKRFDERKTKNKYYVSYSKYLKEAGFMENMVQVLYKMFSLHPTLPEDPITYIRDNYGVGPSEEEGLQRRLVQLSEEVASLTTENLELKERLTRARGTALQPPPQRERHESDKHSSFQRHSKGRGTRGTLSGTSKSKQTKEEAKDEVDLTGIVWTPGIRARPNTPDRPALRDGDLSSPESDYTLTSLGSIP